MNYGPIWRIRSVSEHGKGHTTKISQLGDIARLEVNPGVGDTKLL
jgi:hypothetical protein